MGINTEYKDYAGFIEYIEQYGDPNKLELIKTTFNSTLKFGSFSEYCDEVEDNTSTVLVASDEDNSLLKLNYSEVMFADRYLTSNKSMIILVNNITDGNDIGGKTYSASFTDRVQRFINVKYILKAKIYSSDKEIYILTKNRVFKTYESIIEVEEKATKVIQGILSSELDAMDEVIFSGDDLFQVYLSLKCTLGYYISMYLSESNYNIVSQIKDTLNKVKVNNTAQIEMF